MPTCSTLKRPDCFQTVWMNSTMLKKQFVDLLTSIKPLRHQVTSSGGKGSRKMMVLWTNSDWCFLNKLKI